MYPGPSLQDYRRTLDQAKSYTVLCTGRLERVRSGVEAVLTLHGLEFNEIILKPNDKEQYSRSNVKNYKKNVVATLLRQSPNAKVVNFWDDRVDNIQAIESMRRTYPKITFNLFHILEQRPPRNPTTSILFKNLGLMQDAEFKMAVEEVVELLTKAWSVVLGVRLESTQELVHFFGSYLVKRRSDVDICLLAPSSRSPDECISKLASKLREYGFQFVHEATGIRCPRLKLKAMFCNHASITFDCVVACVLHPSDSQNREIGELSETDFKALYKSCSDKKSKTALDGVLFADKFLIPILDRISESDFGMLVDAVVLMLRREGLKGNAFHCIRTFHVVKMFTDFISSSTDAATVLGKDLDAPKNFEKVLASALRHFASMSVEWYRALFKSFVADSFIQPLMDCFARSAKLSLYEILFAGPRLTKGNLLTRISFQLKSDTSKPPSSSSSPAVDLWKMSTLLEARFGTFARSLIDRGFMINPGHTADGSISFDVDLANRGSEEFMKLSKQFREDFEKEVENGGKSISLGYSVKHM